MSIEEYENIYNSMDSNGNGKIAQNEAELATYPFPLLFEEWELEKGDVAASWDNRGDIIVGNDV